MFGGSKEYDSHERSEAGTVQSATKVPKSAAELTLAVEPNPAKGGADNMFHVTLVDERGNAIPDAQVKVTLVMPAMPSMGMPEMRNSFGVPFMGGMYMGKGNVPMAGSWSVMVEAQRGDQVIATYRTRLSAE
jgi:hypothetical protein